MPIQSATITVMTRTARHAARRVKRDYGEIDQLQVSRKGPADFVTAANTRTEQIIKEELRKARPTFGIVVEGGEDEPGDDPSRRWIIDPIDGTTNFLHGIAHFAISIALEERGQLTAGIVYEPINDQMYWAERGQGTYLNDRRLRVSERKDLSTALIATGIPLMGTDDHPLFLKQLSKIMSASAGVRRFGTASLDLAYVAAGRFDGYWENQIQPWDVAAGIILVREAGGFVSDIDGSDRTFTSGAIVAGNAHLHGVLQGLIYNT